MNEIKFTIDGKTVTGQSGQTILKAAEAVGIYVPRLCAYKHLIPRGSCRICSVRVNGRIQAACVQTISDGMVVENHTAEIQEFRKAIIDMLFPENETGRIPLVAVTSVNGKTTTTRFIAHISKSAGFQTGMVCSDGVYVDGRRIEKGE